ncbi:MAG: uncharacterized protein KVP18_000840, partial [Porospora cf. gigantea A]|uniref:uncharacterized protein n=1 Tax=Porospora cf. gigantea A TaxID=2853593 RepID=UPI00355A163B
MSLLRFRPSVLDHAVLMTPGRLRPSEILTYLGDFHVFTGGRNMCNLEEWLSFSRLRGEEDEEFVTTPGRSMETEGRRNRSCRPTHRLFCAREIHALWSVFTTFVSHIRCSPHYTKLDFRDLGLLLLIQSAKAGGIVQLAEGKGPGLVDRFSDSARAVEKPAQSEGNGTIASAPRARALISPRAPTPRTEEKTVSDSAIFNFLRFLLPYSIRALGRCFRSKSPVQVADFLHLDVLFTVPSGDISCVPAWFDTSAGQSTVSASDAAVVLLERMTCVPFKAIEPLDIGRICCDPHDLAALCIGPSKREAFALDQVALEVVAESLGESLPTLVVVCRGLENCTVYIAGTIGSLKIVDCRHSKVVACAVSSTVSVVNSTSVTLSVACQVLKVENTYDSTTHVYSPNSPIIVGDSRSLTLGPFAVSHSKQDIAMRIAGVTYSSQHVNNWSRPLVISTRKQATEDVYQ